MNISSIIVQTKPENLEQVIKSLKDSEACEYQLNDELGRIVVTVEAKDVSDEIKCVKIIEQLPLVIAADMQMSYCEDELDDNIDVLANNTLVPKILNEDVDVKDIKYNGDLSNIAVK